MNLLESEIMTRNSVEVAAIDWSQMCGVGDVVSVTFTISGQTHYIVLATPESAAYANQILMDPSRRGWRKVPKEEYERLLKLHGKAVEQ